MSENSLIIDSLAKKMATMQSFEFSSFIQARYTVEDGPYYCDFDRLSLHIYEHNLNKDDFYELGLSLRKHFLSSHKKDARKARKEFISLLLYFKCIGNWESITFEKCTRPDFILRTPETIGLEITEFTTKEDSILKNIASENFGSGKTVAEIEAAAFEKHKYNASVYQYYDFGIASPIVDITEIKRDFAEGIAKKYDKYKSDLSSFSKFIILCDTRLSIAITHDYDADEVIEIVKKNHPLMHGFSVHILYENSNCDLVVREYDF